MIQEGDVVQIETDEYTGEATVFYIDRLHLHVDHFFPIQVEIPEGELYQFSEFNHGQQFFRVNLKQILGATVSKPEEEVFIGTEQGNLFDDF